MLCVSQDGHIVCCVWKTDERPVAGPRWGLSERRSGPAASGCQRVQAAPAVLGGRAGQPTQAACVRVPGRCDVWRLWRLSPELPPRQPVAAAPSLGLWGHPLCSPGPHIPHRARFPPSTEHTLRLLVCTAGRRHTPRFPARRARTPAGLLSWQSPSRASPRLPLRATRQPHSPPRRTQRGTPGAPAGHHRAPVDGRDPRTISAAGPASRPASHTHPLTPHVRPLPLTPRPRPSPYSVAAAPAATPRAHPPAPSGDRARNVWQTYVYICTRRARQKHPRRTSPLPAPRLPPPSFLSFSRARTPNVSVSVARDVRPAFPPPACDTPAPAPAPNAETARRVQSRAHPLSLARISHRPPRRAAQNINSAREGPRYQRRSTHTRAPSSSSSFAHPPHLRPRSTNKHVARRTTRGGRGRGPPLRLLIARPTPAARGAHVRPCAAVR